MSMRSSRGSVVGGLAVPRADDFAGSDSRTVTVLLDDSPEGWRALLNALTEAAREGREVRALLLSWPSWTQFATSALQVFYPATCAVLPGPPDADLVDEYNAVLRAHGHPAVRTVGTRRELVRVLTSAPARLIVTGMCLGRSAQSPLRRLGQPTLLVP